jgi:diguanylate cyclase (GGDEF)-like protein/PAS domain S-box-containing protein
MTGKRFPKTLLRAAFLAVVFLMAFPSPAQNDPQRKNILILHSYNREYRWTEDIHTGMMKALASITAPHIICVEYLDWKRFPDETNIQRLHDVWKNKYRNMPIDVILTSDDKALAFAVKYRGELFSNAPIVHTGVFRESVPGLTGGAKNLTGVYEEQDLASTIELALKMQPSPHAAYVICDQSESGKDFERRIKDKIHELFPKLEIWSLSDLKIESIEKYVSRLSPRDLLFIGSYEIDKTGRTYAGEALIGRIGMASKTPVYIFNGHLLGTGAFGGILLSPELMGLNAGNLAVRVLGGAPADSIEPLSSSSFTPMFDWKSIERLNIDASRLPQNSIFLNRDPTFLEKYWRESLAVAAAFIALAFAFAAAFFNYRKARSLAKDLGKRNDEVTLLNDSLSQSEEELRQQNSELISMKENLEESEERYRLSAIGSNEALWDWTYATHEMHFSDRWFEMTGYKPENKASRNVESLVHPEDKEPFRKALRTHLEGESEHFSCEARLRTASGKYMWLLFRGKTVKNESNEIIRFAGSVTDIEDRKNKEAKIENLAYYDQLTSLPNRFFAIETAKAAIQQCEEGKHCGLMFVDIDNFKYINDTFGHPVGDKVLLQCAQVLSSLVNENIHLARFGGDEFTLLVEDTTIDQMEKFGKLAVRLLGRKMTIDGRYHYLTSSAGIALYPDHAESMGELFQKADAALHRAKLTGKTRFFMFNDTIQQELVDRMEIESALRTAIESGELWAAYQPQINADTGKIEGFEALARWNSPRLGNVAPGRFIPVAEETGLIDEIGLFMLRSVAKFIRRASEGGYRDFSVSINVSVKQLHDKDFVSRFIRILKTHDVEPNRITIEITESFMIDDLDPVIARLTELREAGFKLSLDDFGKGYSSLSYLRMLPLDYIKIDKSFIDDILAHGPSVPLAKTIIELSHQLGLKVVAEGVEEREQLDYLNAHGCDYIQGYYYSKPDREESALNQLELSFK